MKSKNQIYHCYQVDDFLLDESFIDWAKGNKSQVEWEEILEKHPHLIPLAEKAKKIIGRLNFPEQEISKDRISALRHRIHKQIGGMEKEGEETNVVVLNQRDASSYRKKNVWMWGAAVAIGILMSAVFLFRQNLWEATPERSSLEYATKSTKKGQKLTTRLSDGTTVVLNSDSRIRYDFNDTARYVSLEGEAFFEVTHDDRPFRVKSNGTVTTALGTSFNIRQKEDQVSISLVTGKVSVDIVSKTGIEKSALLVPGEQVDVRVKEQINFVKGKFDVTEILAWKHGILLFRQVDSKELWQELEKWYGVDIILKNNDVKFQNWDYTGSFDNESLDNVLESISFVKGFEFEIEGDQVLVY